MFALATEESNKVLCQGVSNIGALLVSRIYATSAFCLGLLPTLILYISFVLLSFLWMKVNFQKKKEYMQHRLGLGRQFASFSICTLFWNLSSCAKSCFADQRKKIAHFFFFKTSALCSWRWRSVLWLICLHDVWDQSKSTWFLEFC